TRTKIHLHPSWFGQRSGSAVGASSASPDPLKRDVGRAIVLARLSASREPFREKGRHGGFSRLTLRQLVARYRRAVSVSRRASPELASPTSFVKYCRALSRLPDCAAACPAPYSPRYRLGSRCWEASYSLSASAGRFSSRSMSPSSSRAGSSRPGVTMFFSLL